MSWLSLKIYGKQKESWLSIRNFPEMRYVWPFSDFFSLTLGLVILINVLREKLIKDWEFGKQHNEKFVVVDHKSKIDTFLK